MAAKEILKSGELIEMMMSDKRRPNVKGDNNTNVETEDRLTVTDVDDTEQVSRFIPCKIDYTTTHVSLLLEPNHYNCTNVHWTLSLTNLGKHC